jgi:hypothetical protein
LHFESRELAIAGQRSARGAQQLAPLRPIFAREQIGSGEARIRLRQRARERTALLVMTARFAHELGAARSVGGVARLRREQIREPSSATTSSGSAASASR